MSQLYTGKISGYKDWLTSLRSLTIVEEDVYSSKHYK